MTTQTQHSILEKRRRAQAHAFGICQAVLLVGLVILIAVGMSHRPIETLRLPALSNAPLTVRPRYDDSRVVTDEQLLEVLHKLQPAFGMDQPKINYVDHALRFWGLEATFDSAECLSGQQMRQLLIDDPTFAAAWGTQTRPLLMPTGDGVAVRMQQGNATASHVDHSLASLAEVGTVLDHPVVLRSGATTVESLVTHALQDFSLNQLEYEWTALVLALYAPTPQAWVSKEGQQITFDLLAERIMRQQFSQGVCYGNHRLYTLAVLLRVDDEHNILSAACRQQIIEHLTQATRQLIATQSIDGNWGASWAQDGREEEDTSPEALLRSRILATGHALEWWAMAPEEVHPPREVLVRAGQWLAREIQVMDDETVMNNYTFLSHAGRALALWRGGFPVDVQRRIKSQTENGV